MNRFTALCFSGCLFGLATGRTVTVNGESIDIVVGRGSTAIPMVPELDALYTCKRLNIEPFDNCVEKLTHGHLHEDGSVKCCDTLDSCDGVPPCIEYSAWLEALQIETANRHFRAFTQLGHRFNHSTNRTLYDTVLKDLDLRGGLMTPRGLWHPLNFNFPFNPSGENERKMKLKYMSQEELDVLFEKKYRNMTKMFGGWTGMAYDDDVLTGTLLQFRRVLRHLDVFSMLPVEAYSTEKAFADYVVKNQLLQCDLDTVLDVNLILSHASQRLPVTGQSSPVRVLEIGGGFGRIPEALFSMANPAKVAYLLVDAAPITMVLQYQYLSSAFPGLRVGIYCDEKDMEAYNRQGLGAFDIFILAAWEFSSEVELSRLDAHFDISINVQSMQEMSQWHVDYYINAFNRVTRPGGIVYNSNSRRWMFRGRWEWPNRWGPPIYNQSIPGRSWTDSFWTLVFRIPPETPYYARASYTSRNWTKHEELVFALPKEPGSVGLNPFAALHDGGGVGAIAVAAADWWWTVGFTMDNVLLEILIPPTVVDLETAAMSMCVRLVVRGSTEQQQQLCSAQVMTELKRLAEHKDHEFNHKLGLHPSSRSFSSADRRNPKASGTQACTEQSLAHAVWRTKTSSRALTSNCLGQWSIHSSVDVPQEAGDAVLCVYRCDESH